MEESNIMVDLKQMRKEEYEKQFYGESINEMKTKFTQCLKKVILDSFKQLIKSLIHTFPDKSELITNICNEISHNVIDDSHEHVENFHSLLLKRFVIPDNLILPNDEDQLVQFSEEEESNIDDKIEKLSKEYRKLCAMEELMEKELKYGKFIQELEGELKKLKDAPSIDMGIIENFCILMEGLREI